MVNVQRLIDEQTPVVVMVKLLDGTLRQRVGIITSVDTQVMRVYDLIRAADGTVKGFRSAPMTHVIRIEPIPPQSKVHTLVRRSIAAAYSKGPQ